MRLPCLTSFDWSSVRGIDGILPTDEFLEKLEGDISLARQAWLGAGLNIKFHPKAHLTFDGHLFDQVTRFDGLADKGEDWIERLHQTWKKQKELTWQIPNFANQQMTQLRNMRRSQNARVVHIFDSTDIARSRKNMKRKEEGGASLKEEKDLVRRETKKQRRQASRTR